MLERILKYVFILLLVIHVVGLVFWLSRLRFDLHRDRIIPPEHRLFVIPQGASLNDVLAAMKEKGLAPEPAFVRLFINLSGEKIVVKKGEYQLPEVASTRQILAMFDEGRVALIKLTIPEGLDQWETAEHLAENGWGDVETFKSLIADPTPILEIDPKAKNLEGYLFPETYLFPKKTPPQDIIASMIEMFDEQTAALRPQLGKRGLTVREWVALGSMVEKETSIPNERPRIAGVFENRLEKGMLMQCDPTIVYSLKLENRYRGKIYRSDIKFDHPYNTYVSGGLPPGPIASPGLAALKAAMEPEDHAFFYFVAQADGSHYFSKTLSEHNRAVRRYRSGK